MVIAERFRCRLDAVSRVMDLASGDGTDDVSLCAAASSELRTLVAAQDGPQQRITATIRVRSRS